MQNKIAGDLLILHFGGDGALFYENTTHYLMRRKNFSPALIDAFTCCGGNWKRVRNANPRRSA
jgi:hypothetical protein